MGSTRKTIRKASQHVIAALVIAASLIACPRPAFSAESPTRPNIIFIMSDDHAAHGISAYGSTISRTPNIDRLADEGMRFTHMFGVNSLCAPSRAILITGKHSHTNGMCRNHQTFDASQRTFPKLLQAAGYETALVGKWHLKSEPAGFDYHKVMRGQGRYIDCPLKEKGKGYKVHKGYLTDVITDEAIAWLKGRNTEKPFCLMVHHKAPHGPDIHKPEHAKLYEERIMPEASTLYDDWETRLPLKNGRHTGTKLINCHWGQYRELLASLPEEKVERTRRFYQVFIKGYLRLIASLDENIGRLLDHVDRSPWRDNTIVIYTSDNGFFMGDHGMFNKMWMYEPSQRTPLLVRWPGVVKPKSVNNDLVCNLDFMPTFLETAGVEIPDDLHGRSIVPLLKGAVPDDWRKAIYYHYHGGYEVPPHLGVRTKTHKLIHFPGEHTAAGAYWELFDLRKDPDEMRNVYGQPEYRAVQEELHEQFRALAAETGDGVGMRAAKEHP